METTVTNPLENLVKKLELRNALKRDFVVPTNKLYWTQDGEITINTNDAVVNCFHFSVSLGYKTTASI